MVPSNEPLYSPLTLIFSVFWCILAIALHAGMTRVTKNTIALIGLWVVTATFFMFPLLAIIWGGELIFFLWTHPLIWVNITNGLTIQYSGFGPTDFCRCFTFPKNGTLALNHTHMAMLAIPMAAIAIMKGITAYVGGK